jgi:hypothetical protein
VNKFGRLAYACTIANPDLIRSVRWIDVFFGLVMHGCIAFLLFKFLPPGELIPSVFSLAGAVGLLVVRLMYVMYLPDETPLIDKLLLMQFLGSAVILGVFVLLVYFDVTSRSSIAYAVLFGHYFASINEIRLSCQRESLESPPSSFGPERSDDALRVMRAARIKDFGPHIGMVMDHPIPEWIELSNGKIYHYKRYVGSASLDDLAPGELVIAPGLLYTEGSDGPA